MKTLNKARMDHEVFLFTLSDGDRRILERIKRE